MAAVYKKYEILNSAKNTQTNFDETGFYADNSGRGGSVEKVINL
jgi:hypothetical protein